MARFDTLIHNARVIDGSGNPWFAGEVAIAGDSIAAITPPGKIPHTAAIQVVDAGGAVLCPGFIDIPRHSI